MSDEQKKSLWELLWDYDPNGLIVVDTELRIRLVNQAFCKMFGVDGEAVVGQEITTLFDDVDDFRIARDQNTVIPAKEKHYGRYHVYVRKVIFPIQDEGIIACIMVNMTHEWQQEKNMRRVRQETILKVKEVVDNQMKVAQEIASLLGETTAETKVSLLRLLQVVEQKH
jgi:PAS domain S-box-containing protein